MQGWAWTGVGKNSEFRRGVGSGGRLDGIRDIWFAKNKCVFEEKTVNAEEDTTTK